MSYLCQREECSTPGTQEIARYALNNMPISQDHQYRKMYAVVEFEKIELDSSLHSTRKAYTPETRYDAQYATYLFIK